MNEHGFEGLLAKTPSSPLKEALIEVVDTAWLCRRWLSEFELTHPFTNDHVIALTRLVLLQNQLVLAELETDDQGS